MFERRPEGLSRFLYQENFEGITKQIGSAALRADTSANNAQVCILDVEERKDSTLTSYVDMTLLSWLPMCSSGLTVEAA